MLRKSKRDALVQQAAAAFFERCPFGVILLDRSLTILDVNAQQVANSGLERERFVEQSLEQLFAPVTEAALSRMTDMIEEAINAPDTCPAAPLLLNIPAPTANSTIPAPVDLSALRPTASARMNVAESPVELTAIREGGSRGA